MDFFGVIRGKAGGRPFTYDGWCEVVRSRADLVQSAPRTGRNPATGESVTIHPRRDSATVIVNGQELGHVYWSFSGEDEVVVTGEAALIIRWARDLAAEIGGEFEVTQE